MPPKKPDASVQRRRHIQAWLQNGLSKGVHARQHGLEHINLWQLDLSAGEKPVDVAQAISKAFIPARLASSEQPTSAPVSPP